MDIAVVINLKARRGSERIVRACRAALPAARILASRSLAEAERIAASLCEAPSDLIVTAGGDGTALALLNAMRPAGDTGHTPLRPSSWLPPPPGFFTAPPPGALTPATALGVLPLGTGNAWAHATGAPRWRHAMAELGRLAGRRGALPLRRFDLVEVEGTVGHFAGTGWDAELIDDFNAQKTGPGVLPVRHRNGLAGYLQGLFLRTVPRHFTRRSMADVELTNTGEDALTIDDRGRPIPLAGGEHGKVLYRGPMNVCGAATNREWGFRFRAFPFAGLVPRRFHMRIYGASVLEAVRRSPDLWRGVHPLPLMHNWFLTRCRAVFSRPVPFQIGGDRLGQREVVEFSLADEQVDLLNWSALRAV